MIFKIAPFYLINDYYSQFIALILLKFLNVTEFVEMILFIFYHFKFYLKKQY